MFFKVNTTGCQECKGLVEVRYDLYLDPDDERYSEHYFKNKIDGTYQHNPFCCHFVQFEPTVTDEEIEYVGKLALDMKYKDWIVGNLSKTKNKPVTFSDNHAKKAACAMRVDKIKKTTWSAVSLGK